MSPTPEGRKDDQGKEPMDLLSPLFLLGVSQVLAFGAERYGSYNWAHGIVYSRVFAALNRHIWCWWGGEENDPETGHSHLFHAGCCLMFLAHYAAAGYTDYDDRPKWGEFRG